MDGDLISVDAAGEMFGVQLGPVVLRTHGNSECSGGHCCIHNPSDHHMRTWRQNWRGDRGLMERICKHGIGHPDPDHIAHVARTQGDRQAGGEAIHGCDGCCRPITPEEET